MRREKIKPPWHLGLLLSLPFPTLPLWDVLWEDGGSCLRLGSSPWISAALDLGKGVAQHWEFLPQSPALTLRFQTCPGSPRKAWEEAGAGRDWESAFLRPSLPQPPRPLGKEPPSGMGARRGAGSWNPEQRVERLTAVTAIVQTKAMVQKLSGCWHFVCRLWHSVNAFDNFMVC